MRVHVGLRTRAAAFTSFMAVLLVLGQGSAHAALSLDTTLCAGTDLAMGTLLADMPSIAASDCTIGFGTDSGNVQLRTYQQDGVGTAAPGIADIAAGTSDWGPGDELFGSCLRSLSAIPTTSWAIPGDGTCDPTGADPWNRIPTTSGDAAGLVAHLTTGSYTANLRFGARAATSTPGGAYAAPIVIEVIQPAPAPPSNTTLPMISGTTTVGQVLTTTNGTWAGSPSSYAYQWRRCNAAGGACADIGGATANTYTLVAGDVDATIRVVVTATNLDGSTPATSAQTLQIAGIAPTAGTASTSGTATAGQTLTASTGGVWTPGTPAAGATTWQWRRCNAAGASCVDIAGATASTYVLATADVDSTIRVVASRTNTCAIGCNTASATSNQSPQVAGVAPTAGTAAITGIAGIGQTLSASETGAWTYGMPTAVASHQWRRCDSAGNACVDIAGATSSTYVAQAADVDLTLRVVITRTNTCAAGCNSAPATSGQFGTIEPIAFVQAASNGTNSGTSMGISKPAGTLTGHLMVAQISVRDQVVGGITPPAGWTLIRETNNADRITVASYYKVATGTEPGSYTYTWSSLNDATGTIVSFANAAVPVDVISANAVGTSTTITIGQIDPSVANTMLVALYATRIGTTWTTYPTGMTTRADQIVGANIRSLFATQRLTADTLTGTRQAVAAASDRFAAHMFALRPLP